MKSYSLPELVRASALPVDTIRYYQSLGLLDGPRRRGRTAVYNDSHLKRLRLIRSMSARGLPLKVVKTLVSSSKKDVVDRALVAAVKEKAGEARYTSTQFADRLGIPKGLLDLVDSSELREAVAGETGDNLYSDVDLEAARGGSCGCRHLGGQSRCMREESNIRHRAENLFDTRGHRHRDQPCQRNQRHEGVANFAGTNHRAGRDA